MGHADHHKLRPFPCFSNIFMFFAFHEIWRFSWNLTFSMNFNSSYFPELIVISCWFCNSMNNFADSQRLSLTSTQMLWNTEPLWNYAFSSLLSLNRAFANTTRKQRRKRKRPSYKFKQISWVRAARNRRTGRKQAGYEAWEEIWYLLLK